MSSQPKITSPLCQDNSSEFDQTNQIKALNVLTNGIRLAQSRGAFTLAESSLLYDNLKIFMVDSNLEPNALIPKKEDEVKTV